MNATTQAQELANKLITAGAALSNGDTNTIKTIDTLRDVINDEQQYLPEAPTEPGYYIPRDGTTFILSLDGDGDWIAKELDLSTDSRFDEVRKDGDLYHPWSFIVRLLPETALPLIPLTSVTDLKFTYKLKEENDND